jgi:plastocyanin
MQPSDVTTEGDMLARPTGRSRWGLRVLAAAAVAAIAAAGAAMLLRMEESPPQPPVVADIAVSLHDGRFGRGTYEIDAGRPVRVRVSNRDRIFHTFTIPSLGIDRGVSPGGSIVMDVEAGPGEYTIYCRPHSDMSQPDPAVAGMAARLVVK